MSEALTEHFFTNGHNGWHNDLKVQIIVIHFCDTSNPEQRKKFLIYHLNTQAPSSSCHEVFFQTSVPYVLVGSVGDSCEGVHYLFELQAAGLQFLPKVNSFVSVFGRAC